MCETTIADFIGVHLQVPTNATVHLEFQSFQVENTTACADDHLDVKLYGTQTHGQK